MNTVRGESIPGVRPSPVFLLGVLTTLATAGLIALMVAIMQVHPGFLGMFHFTDPHHRIHDLSFGFLFGVTSVGLVAQVRRPVQNVAGMAMALVPWLGLLLAAVSSADPFSVLVINPSLRVALATL